jgi:hypothetical protein
LGLRPVFRKCCLPQERVSKGLAHKTFLLKLKKQISLNIAQFNLIPNNPTINNYKILRLWRKLANPIAELKRIIIWVSNRLLVGRSKKLNLTISLPIFLNPILKEFTT